MEFTNPALAELADTLSSEPKAPETESAAQTPETKVETQVPTVTDTASPEVTQTPAETPAEVEETPAWFEVEDTPVATQPVNQPQTQTTQAQAEPQEKDPFQDDPDLKALLAYKKSGKTLHDFVSDHTVPDYTKMAADTLVEKGLKEVYGFEGEELAEAIEEYKVKSPLERKGLENQFRAYYEKEGANKLKEITASAQANMERANAVIDKYNADVDAVLGEMNGKEIFGVTVNDEMLNTVRTGLQNFNLTREDGTFNAEVMVEIVFLRNYIKEIVKTNVTRAKNQGKRQILQEVSNPSREMTGDLTTKTGPEDSNETINQWIAERQKTQGL